MAEVLKVQERTKDKRRVADYEHPIRPMQVSGQELRFDRKLIFGEPVPDTHADGKCEHLESVGWLIEESGFRFGGTQIAELTGAVVLPK